MFIRSRLSNNLRMHCQQDSMRQVHLCMFMLPICMCVCVHTIHVRIYMILYHAVRSYNIEACAHDFVQDWIHMTWPSWICCANSLAVILSRTGTWSRVCRWTFLTRYLLVLYPIQPIMCSFLCEYGCMY